MVDMSAEAFDEWFPVWLLWASTDKKYLPEDGGLLDQNYIGMQTILEIDSLYNKLYKATQKDS